MTSAHRPTFDPARGKEALRGPAYHQRLLPAYTQLKFRQPGQGGNLDDIHQTHDLRSELLAAEAAHKAKLRGGAAPAEGDDEQKKRIEAQSGKRPLALEGDGKDGDGDEEDEDEDPAAKRRRILEETRDIDADEESDEEEEDDDDDDDSDDDSEDEEAELQRELERVRRERAEKRAKEEQERAAAEAEEREREIARGNPLLNATDFSVKRRWDDDVVFKNQARGTEDKGKKEFINDLLRSDFHRRFMNKYVR